MKNEVLITVARVNFWAFCCYYDWDFFRVNRSFLYQIAVALQQIFNREILTLSISMPPRAGKSYIISLFCAWLIGMRPEGSVMRNSCTATLYRKFSYDVREIIKSDKFKNVFPEVTLSPDKASVDGWNVAQAKQVSYFGNGVGGTIIGFGASLAAITDDLYRGHDDVWSPTVNEKIHSWYSSAHKSRMELDCPQIDISTRWSIKDVIGVNSENKFYDKEIIVPALIDGKSFCENVKSTKEYQKIKKETVDVIWDSEYMQQPAEVSGTLMPRSKLKRYSELNDEGTSLCFIDTADKGSDHFSAPFGKLLGNKIYITDAIFNLIDLHNNKSVCKSRFEKHKMDMIFIETNSAGSLFMEDLKTENPDLAFWGKWSSVNKMSRILSQVGWILEFVYFPEHPNEELNKFMVQLCSITHESKEQDDAADSLSGLAEMVRKQYLAGL